MSAIVLCCCELGSECLIIKFGVNDNFEVDLDTNFIDLNYSNIATHHEENIVGVENIKLTITIATQNGRVR